MQQLTLRTDHIITETKINEAAAKRHLLHWSGRSTLNSKTTSLCHSINSLLRWHTAWNMSPALAVDHDFAMAHAAATGAFDCARKVIARIAGLSVLYEKTQDPPPKKKNNYLND